MFGYVKPWLDGLTNDQQKRYRSVYCGVCRSLGQRYGSVSRLAVSYDLGFLALVLSSLYEPEEQLHSARCLPHPIRAHDQIASPVIDYAADLTVALTYYKCLDDWQDERSQTGRLMANRLKEHYVAVKSRWPDQCQAIEEGIARLSAVEKSSDSSLEAAVDAASLMTSELFVMKQDFWSGQLRRFGKSLGSFIYLMDAVMDFEEDQTKGRFNPLSESDLSPENIRALLTQPLGSLSDAFEGLPLVNDLPLMRNIIYSGVWQEYNRKTNRKTEGAAHGS